MSLDVYLCCPHCEHELFSRNITHNVHRISSEAGADPWEYEGRVASETLAELNAAIAALTAEPWRFKQYEPANGWGSVEGICDFLRAMRDAAEKHPSLVWKVSR